MPAGSPALNLPPHGFAIRNSRVILDCQARETFWPRCFCEGFGNFIGRRRLMSYMLTRPCLADTRQVFFRKVWIFHLLLPFMVWMFSIVVFRMGLRQGGVGKLRSGSIGA